MSKELEIQKIMNAMKVGDIYHFPTGQENQNIEVERIFFGKSPAWAVYHLGERQIVKETTEVIRLVARNWNQDLKKVMAERYTDLREIIDLGEY